MCAQAKHVGTNIITDMITDIDLVKTIHRHWTIRINLYGTNGHHLHRAKARWQNWIEKAYRGFGVSACATCDGFFYRGRSRCHRRWKLRRWRSLVPVTIRQQSDTHSPSRFFACRKIAQDRLFSNPKVSVIWNATIEEILEIHLAQQIWRHQSQRIKIKRYNQRHCLILKSMAFSLQSVTTLQLNSSKGKIDMDKRLYIWRLGLNRHIGRSVSSQPGDIKDKTYRQAVTAAGMGCMSALKPTAS